MGISKVCLAWVGAAALGAAATMGSARALAADTAAPASSAELEEITVTAEKRAETQQNVPLSMTTFSDVALQEKQINNFFDYATKVPNLAFAPTGDGVSTSRTISIRGISGDNVTSFYIDDTPLPDSIDPRVLDLDHIEVLRGPQGTLYGARSMGGLVRIVTKEPNLTTSDGSVHAGTLLHRTHRPAELDRRRRVQRTDRRGSRCAAIRAFSPMMRQATSSAASAPIRRPPWRSPARRSRPSASPR